LFNKEEDALNWLGNKILKYTIKMNGDLKNLKREEFIDLIRAIREFQKLDNVTREKMSDYVKTKYMETKKFRKYSSDEVKDYLTHDENLL